MELPSVAEDYELIAANYHVKTTMPNLRLKRRLRCILCDAGDLATNDAAISYGLGLKNLINPLLRR